MRSILIAARVAWVFLNIVFFLVHMSVVWLFVWDHWRRVRWSNKLMRIYCFIGLRLLRLKVNTIGLENLHDLRGALYVGNHLTYMDVLAISSNVPVCFVTSTEIKAAPLLGQICTLAGCLFVERRNKQNIRNEISQICDALKLGLNVAIFPEATSTNGEQILRFRRPLFLTAIDAGRPVVPFCLNYRKVGGQPISTDNRDKICWYGDMGFAPHIWALAASGGVELDLHFLKPIETRVDMDAGALAEQSQHAVESVFIPIKKNEGPLTDNEPSLGVHETQ